MTDEIFDKLKHFIVKETGVDDDEVIREAGIEEDLGIYGDDAMELLIAYGKYFNVDTGKFMAADYFSPEGDPILPAIIRIFTGKQERKTKILTIRHLEKGIHAGRLDEEVINS
jgi:acyl carrier protein